MTALTRLEERLRNAGLPDPAPELRQRVLAAAGPLVTPGEPATWSDRVWFSRRWRYAAVALVIALVALDRVSVMRSSPTSVEFGTIAVESATAAEDAAIEAGIARDEADRLARRALLAESRPATPEPRAALGLAQ